MEPATHTDLTPNPEHHVGTPPVVPQHKPGRLKDHLHRTTFGLTAEYSVFLIAFGIVLGNLITLLYMFFGLIVAATLAGGIMAAFAGSHLFTLWLLISSVIALPTAVILWSRVRGELAAGDDAKGDLPKGAAKGFRTFWIIVNVLTIIGLKMAALFAPIATAVSGGPVVEPLLAVSVPSLLSAALLAVGTYMVVRPAAQQGKNRLLLWVAAGLITMLFVVNYAWASTIKAESPGIDIDMPAITPPSSEYDDLYRDLYDDPYYDYSDPETLIR